MEDSDAIIFPILKEAGCEIAPDITSIKQLLDEHVYQIAAGCLHAINVDNVQDLPRKFPTSKATKFRVATQVATILKQIGFQGEIGYQSILYPHEQDTRKIISFLIERLPRKEQQQLDFDNGSTSVEMRIQLALQTINPTNQYKIFQHGRYQRDLKHFDSSSLRPYQNNTADNISDKVKQALNSRPQTNMNTNTTLQTTLWSTFNPTFELSTSTHEQATSAQLLPSIIQSNTSHILHTKRQEDRLLPQNQLLHQKLQAQLQSNLQASFKSALSEAKNAQTLYEQQRLNKFKNVDLNKNFVENVFSRKAQFTQENAVALTSTEPIVSLEEQLAKDQAEYDELVKQRTDELTSLQDQLELLFQQYKLLTSNIDELNSSIIDMNSSSSQLDTTIESLEATYKTRCHVIDFLPNAQENIEKLRQLTDTNMGKITKLNTEWEKLRQEMIIEHRTLQNQHDERQVLFNANLLILQNLRAEIKSKGADVRAKEDQYNLTVQEYDSMPKNINRNVYIKRIMEIVKNIDKQNEEIGTILTDIKSVQREITNKGESVKRSFTEADDLIYNTAKSLKSSVAIGIYKDVVTLRDGFTKIIDNVETIGKKQNIIRELGQSIELIQDRGTLNNFDSVLGDLESVQQENAELKAKIAAKGGSNDKPAKKSTKGNKNTD